MRLSLLIEELAAKFEPEQLAVDALAASAAQTSLIARLTAIDSARAGSVGRGLQLASEELQELALLTGSQDKNLREMAGDAQAVTSEIQQVFNCLGTDRWPNTAMLLEELRPLKERVSALVGKLEKNLAAMPRSLGDYEPPESADRVQLETLLRQTLIQGRDRLMAVGIIVEFVFGEAQLIDDVERLLILDTSHLEHAARQKLAALTRDKRLDDSILSSKMAN